MSENKPSKLTLTDLERKSMDADSTYSWLKSQGLDFSVAWDEQNPKPVLMITTEKYRESVIKNAPSLLLTSFVIVRSPINASFLKYYGLYEVGIGYQGPGNAIGREYDVYSIDPENGEVLFVQPKQKNPRGVSGFQTELPYCVIDDKNKKILEELGCNFNW